MSETTCFLFIQHGKKNFRGTPAFPVEGLRQKRSQENSEKSLANFLSKNFDSNN